MLPLPPTSDLSEGRFVVACQRGVRALPHRRDDWLAAVQTAEWASERASVSECCRNEIKAASGEGRLGDRDPGSPPDSALRRCPSLGLGRRALSFPFLFNQPQ